MNHVRVSPHPQPMFLEVSPDEFGRIFSTLNSGEQVAVFRSMLDHMSKHPIQWDYVSIEMNLTENHDVRSRLRDILDVVPETELMETLRSVKLWIRQWRNDVDCGLKPTKPSLERVEREVSDVISKFS